MDLFQKVETKKRPTFEIESLRACELEDELWLSCVCIYRGLGNSSSRAHICSQARKHANVEKRPVNLEWSSGEWYNADGPEQLMVRHADLPAFVESIMKRQRKTKQQKVDLMRKLNVEAPDISVPIECSVLDTFIRACPFAVELQFRVGKHRLDAFVPRLRLAIQVDEGGHTAYDQAEEKDYDAAMRDHNIVCLRFVPSSRRTDTENGLALVSLVWQRTMSPDFKAFARQQDLR
jgi:very-short-patch-repair endonuclease